MTATFFGNVDLAQVTLYLERESKNTQDKVIILSRRNTEATKTNKNVKKT